MQLSEPRPKKYCRLKPSLPLPIVKNSNNEIIKFKGNFNGFSVVVEDENEMKQIITMGYFGKANLSRSFPTFLKGKGRSEILRKRQFERRNEWGKKFGDKKLNKKCIVVPDSDDENNDYFKNLKPQYEADCSGLRENVYLSFEEAFFLQYFVECLNVSKGNSILSPRESWELFKKYDKNFVTNYVVYHYYRAKNWVVKPGIKFGGDYLLYKQGPPFYHASYLVIIDIVDENMKRIDTMTRRSMNTVHIQGLNRLCETAAKELMICQLVWPSGLTDVQIEDITKFEVKEVLMQRWLPSAERQPDEYD